MAVNLDINRAPAWNPIKSVAPAPPGASLSTTVTVTAPVVPPMSHRRQSSGNIPDIVENDNCLQTSSSDIGITSSTGTSAPLTTNIVTVNTQGSDTEISHRNVEGVNRSQERTVSTLEETNRRLSGSSDARVRSQRSSSSSTNMVPLPTTYISRENQHIQTQDLNVGVSSRLEPAPHSDVPDLLHSHMVPQPPVISSPTHPNHMRHMPRDWRGLTPESQARHHRHHRHGGHSRSARQRRSRTNSRSSYSEHESCKEACYKCVEVTTSFRWILVILSLLGVCCVVTGIVLAALHAAGSSFLFLAIMFIGEYNMFSVYRFTVCFVF